EDRVVLTRQIVARVATRADEMVDPWQARRGVLEAKDHFQRERIDHEGLAEVQARVDQRCLDERLTDVSAFLIAGDTQAAAQRVNSTLAELAGGKAGRSKVNLAELGKSGALASDVVSLNSELAALSRVEAALQAAGARRRTQLLGVDITNVPKTVKESLKDLR